MKTESQKFFDRLAKAAHTQPKKQSPSHDTDYYRAFQKDGADTRMMTQSSR